MKKYYSGLLILILFVFTSACNKDLSKITTTVIDKMMVNKTWYLDYSITGNNTQSFLGQSTYSMTYFKDGTTKDSDGLTGTYKIIENNGNYQIQVVATSLKGNALNYTHTIESVGEVNMIQSFILTGQASKTSLYFTSK